MLYRSPVYPSALLGEMTLLCRKTAAADVSPSMESAQGQAACTAMPFASNNQQIHANVCQANCLVFLTLFLAILSLL